MAAYAGIDDFESYSVGNLNGGNGGSGWFAVWVNAGLQYQVESSVTLGTSTRAVLVDNPPNNTTASRILSSSVNSGEQYFAFRRASGSGGYGGLDFLSGGPLGVGSLLGGIQNDGSNIGAFGGSGGGTIFASPADDTWYIVHVVFLTSTTFKARAKVSGGSFGSYCADATYIGGGSNPDTIEFRVGSSGGAGKFYFDALGITDPEPPPPTGPVNVKTVDGLTAH